MDKQIRVMKETITHPSKAFKEISHSGNSYVLGASVLFAISILLGVVPHFTLAGLASDIVAVLLGAGTLYIVSKWLKGSTTFPEMFSALGYAMMPVILTSLVFLLLSAALPQSTHAAMDAITAKVNTFNNQTNISVANYTQQRDALAQDVLSDVSKPNLLIPLIIGLIVGLGGLAWRIALLIIAVMAVNRFSSGKAIGALLLNILVYTVAAIAISLLSGLTL